MQESRPGGNAPLPFMGRTTDKGRFRFFRFRFPLGPPPKVTIGVPD